MQISVHLNAMASKESRTEVPKLDQIGLLTVSAGAKLTELVNTVLFSQSTGFPQFSQYYFESTLGIT